MTAIQQTRSAPRPAAGISFSATAGIAVGALAANKIRTALTALGVVIGVASVIALLAVGRGAQEQVAQRITAGGANLLTVRAEGAAGGGDATLTLADARALADPASVPDAAAVAPVIDGVSSVVAGAESTTTIIQGVTAEYATIRNQSAASGELIGESHEHAAVAVLGARVAAELFPDGDAVGQTVRIRSYRFRVIGVLAARGGFNFDDDAVFVPLDQARRSLFGGRVGGKAAVSSIIVQARGREQIEAARAQIEGLLRERHRLPAEGGEDDFTIDNQQDLINTLTATSRTMTLALGAIAAISLLVGGIGIMNIMLVSVRERTREIGLRKAVGARERDILRQFLIEALAVSVGGGLAGLLIGLLISAGVNLSGQARATPSVESALLAIGVALAIGLVFGIEPARRAARLDPIEALRYE
jgi:putative ABC transport system permease protein